MMIMKSHIVLFLTQSHRERRERNRKIYLLSLNNMNKSTVFTLRLSATALKNTTRAL